MIEILYSVLRVYFSPQFSHLLYLIGSWTSTCTNKGMKTLNDIIITMMLWLPYFCCTPVLLKTSFLGKLRLIDPDSDCWLLGLKSEEQKWENSSHFTDVIQSTHQCKHFISLYNLNNCTSSRNVFASDYKFIYTYILKHVYTQIWGVHIQYKKSKQIEKNNIFYASRPR